ncbi:MAG: sialidase family protein [Gemmatimonadota bacterium]
MTEPRPQPLARPSAARAVDFESRRVYASAQRPSYTSWVSFFPGLDGHWHIGCEEVTRPDPPLPQCGPQQWQAMGLPEGYDKSQYRMEAVLLESDAALENWRVISRQPYRQHHTVGQFATARAADGRFLRFIWACYSLEDGVGPADILQTSADGGRTWEAAPPFHHPAFCSYPHRLRTLRDGTLVLCLPLSPRWGTPERPLRTCTNLDAAGEMQMTLWFSFDGGRAWDGPLPIYSGHQVSETDFAELPSGDLLCVNSTIFACPGRQVVYRQGRRFTPGPFERARGRTGPGEPNLVPETVCRTAAGPLVGCLRAGRYQWSDDEGRTWWPVAGIPERGPEVYQPWIHCLPDGRLACAGHYGADDPITGGGRVDQYVSLHLFRLQVEQPTEETRLYLEREMDASGRGWTNRYALRLTAGGRPLAERRVELWYVERDAPGYDAFGRLGLEERMARGGHRLELRTDADGRALADLSHLQAADPHRSIQLVARFNADGQYREHKPCQSCQFEHYIRWRQDPPLAEEAG